MIISRAKYGSGSLRGRDRSGREWRGAPDAAAPVGDDRRQSLNTMLTTGCSSIAFGARPR
jgi:hypothetical protein